MEIQCLPDSWHQIYLLGERHCTTKLDLLALIPEVELALARIANRR